MMDNFENIRKFTPKIEFTKEDNPRKILCESSFALLFPRYREKYIRECWPALESKLFEYEIACELDLIEGSMKVTTTENTWDPYMIIKARDVIKNLARSVPLQHALRCLSDDVYSSIVKIGSMVRNRTRFKKRRQRLMGSEGSTLKAIELLTGCYMAVHGNTVALVGSLDGVREAEKIVSDCMNNIHPIYNIKSLMIKKELAKDESLANESWDRFMPKFISTSTAPKKKKSKKTKKPYTPFPPPQPLSKVDMQLRSGEYFMNDAAKKRLKDSQLEEQQKEKRIRREKNRTVDVEDQITLPAVETPPVKSGELVDSIKKKTKKRKKSDF